MLREKELYEACQQVSSAVEGFREQVGLSQKDFADELGMQVYYLWVLENIPKIIKRMVESDIIKESDDNFKVEESKGKITVTDKKTGYSITVDNFPSSEQKAKAQLRKMGSTKG